MKIVKTYARWFTNDPDAALPMLRTMLGRSEDYRFALNERVEIIGIGDICMVAGDDEALAPFRDTVGPVVVDNLDDTRAGVVAAGLTISRPEQQSATGRYLYARFPDGVEVEFLQLNA